MKRIIIILGLVFLISTAFLMATSRFIVLEVTPEEIKDSATITVNLENPTTGNIYIQDMHGNLMRSIFNGQLERGKTIFQWDRTNDEGEALPDGRYQCILETETRYTSVMKIIILK